jgi:hypothetical protein
LHNLNTNLEILELLSMIYIMSDQKEEDEQKIETKGDDSIVMPSQPEHSAYDDDDDDDRRGFYAHLRQPAYQGDEEQEESVAPTLVRQTNQLPLTDSEDDDFYDNNLAQPSMFAVHEGAAAQQRRLEMMGRVERRTSQDRHRSVFADRKRTSGLDQQNPEYYEYRGFKVNLTRFLHGSDHKTSSWKRPLARMELHTAIDKIIKLKKEMLDANKAAKKDPNDRDKWIQVHTRAYALKVALAKISYNLDAYGGRIFDGHNRQYEGGQNGWRTIMWNAREHLKKIHNPSYTMQPTTWLGGRTRRARKRKTRKRKTRKRKTHKRKKGGTAHLCRLMTEQLGSAAATVTQDQADDYCKTFVDDGVDEFGTPRKSNTCAWGKCKYIKPDDSVQQRGQAIPDESELELQRAYLRRRRDLLAASTDSSSSSGGKRKTRRKRKKRKKKKPRKKRKTRKKISRK